MARYVRVVQVDPVEGMEEEFNRWYDNDHLDDLLQPGGFTSCRRFRALDSPPGHAERSYLTMYEIETDDLEAFDAQRRALPKGASSDAVKKGNIGAYYELVTELSAADVARRRSIRE